MKTIFYAFCFIAVAGYAFAAETGKNSWSEENAEATYGELAERIQNAEALAIDLLRDAKFDDEYFSGPVKQSLYAIKFLGLVRSRKAVPVLCDRLLFKQFFNSIVGDRLLYPASAALVEIGDPAVHGLLTRVAQFETSLEYRRVAIGILDEIVGAEKLLPLIKEFRSKQEKQAADRIAVLQKEYEEHLKRLGENR
jgi:hypothetical protein